MSTVDIPQTDRHRRRAHRTGPAKPVDSTLAGKLTLLTDVCLMLTLTAVTLCFAGRTPIGQFVLVGLTSLTAIVWSLRQSIIESSGWRATGTLWIWCLGVSIAIIQITPLPTDWLQFLSPEHGRLLPLWSSASTGMFPAWTTLSFNPTETRSGLVTFLCYALIFLVTTQRIATQADVERILRGVACVGMGVAAFALLQFLFSNGLYFWCYDYPLATTRHYAVGPFSNRNHLGQFLAMMVGPTMLWLVQMTGQPVQPTRDFGTRAGPNRVLSIGLIAMGLSAILLTGLMSLSRGGVAAMALATMVCLVLFSRRGQLPTFFLPVVLVVGLAVGAGAVATNYQLLASRFDLIQSGPRETIWAANFRLAKRFPVFGTGIGTHAASHPLEVDLVNDSREFSHAESGYLQIASECGLFGLAVVGLMILSCLSWSRTALKASTEANIAVAAGAITASLVANLLHAAVDFFWFAPGCMLVVTLLAACLCRLSQFAKARQGFPEQIRSRSRLVWSMTTVGMTALAAWMISVKLPSALAEPDHTAYLRLLYRSQPPEDEDLHEIEREKMIHLIAAARLNPSDSRSQVSVAAGYLRIFQLKQEASDNPMTLDQLRDAAIASEFESAQALHKWLDAAVGPHKKYLLAAQHYSRKALRNCPLEGLAYVRLARLDFLRDPQTDQSSALQEQALIVRPFDATVDFEVGRLASQAGDLERAKTHWRKAFHRDFKLRREIAEGLAVQMSAAKLIETFAPDRVGLSVVLRAYETAHRDEELPLLRAEYINACLTDARRMPAETSEPVWLEAIKTYQATGEIDTAAQVAREALETHGQSLELHQRYGKILIELGDFRRAAKHLKWAAARAPDNAALQRLAAETTRQALRAPLASAEQPLRDSGSSLR